MNLSYDIFKKVLTIKAKVFGYLKNLTDNTIEYIDTTCKINHNKYLYFDRDTTYSLNIDSKEIIFTRDNSEMNHTITFKQDKITPSEYYIKELHHSLEFNIKTTYMEVTENKIKINYQILETDNKYEYIIEMSDIK